MKALILIIDPSQKTKTIIKNPNVIIVDQMHRGDHATISDAISAASPGSLILVRPGVYDEGLIIDKPLEILGDGNPGDVIIRSMKVETVRFRAIRGKISNLTLRRQDENYTQFGIDIVQGCLEVNGCDIASKNRACIAVHGNAYPRIISNKIHDGMFGVAVFENGQGLIEDNDIYNNNVAGINIQEGGNPIVRKNRINKNGINAIWIHEKSAGTIEDNDLRENEFGAWDSSKDIKSLIKYARNLEK